MSGKVGTIFGCLLLVAVLAAAAPAPARANAFEAVSRGSAELLSLNQQLTQGVLLVALDVDKKAALERLAGHGGRFEAALKDLRGQSRWSAALVARFERIEFFWGQYAALLKGVQAGGQAGREQAEQAATIEALLEEAIRNFVEDVKADSQAAAYHSLFFTTVDVARLQAVLSQQVFKEFLLIADGVEVENNKRDLNKSYSLLDRSFQALIYGDSELQLMPAPNSEVERHWEEARKIWLTFRPTIKAAAASGEVDRAMIAEIAGRSAELLGAMNMAVDAYLEASQESNAVQ